jgi:hypothetical protein
MRNFLHFFQGKSDQDFITIVSGLPRSGTSMMMTMLAAGGVPAYTDNIRAADEDNPKGYYELERVKKMPDGDIDWLPEAKGKAVKVISALLEHLPPEYNYRVLFMQRKMEEVLASQKQMLIRNGKPTDTVRDEQLADMYAKHLVKVNAWLADQANFSVLDLDYNKMLDDPSKYADYVNNFLGGTLDVEAMVGVVDNRLYRQRA